MNPHRKPHIRLTNLPDSVESPDRTPFTLRYAPHFTRGNRSAAKISICFRTAKPERRAMGPIRGKDTRQGTVFRLPRHATGYSHGSRERLLILRLVLLVLAAQMIELLPFEREILASPPPRHGSQTIRLLAAIRTTRTAFFARDRRGLQPVRENNIRVHRTHIQMINDGRFSSCGSIAKQL